MGETLTDESLIAARVALDTLAEESSNSRAVEANMDILSTALMNLGVVKFSAHRRLKANLCEVLQEFVTKKHLDPVVVRCCRGITELIQVADYDISDFDVIEEEIHGEIKVLQEEVELAFACFEKQII